MTHAQSIQYLIVNIVHRDATEPVQSDITRRAIARLQQLLLQKEIK